jgi:hypothetical protein
MPRFWSTLGCCQRSASLPETQTAGRAIATVARELEAEPAEDSYSSEQSYD